MNTTELITALKLHGSFPTSNDLFSDEDFLSLYNHQMMAEITPLLLGLNEEYFLQSKTFDITQGSLYRIPTRAIGSNIRTLFTVNAQGDKSSISRLFEEDRPNSATGYYVVRNSIELSNDFTSGTLEMKYFGRPSTLVLTTACGSVSAIDTTAKTVEVTSAPTTFTTGAKVDFVQSKNPFDLLGMDYELTGVSGTTLNFAALPEGLEIGDWVCLATESPVPMIPAELHPLLVQSALCKTLSSKKDKQFKEELETFNTIKTNAINMLDPRVKDNSAKVRTGPLLGYFQSRRY